MNETDLLELKLLIETNPLWYQNPQIKDFLDLFNKNKLSKAEKTQKTSLMRLFKNSNFLIGGAGYNWDQERLPVDYAVIHHTASSPTISLNELNILGLRLYINQYLTDKDVINQPIYSGHYWYGNPKTMKNMTFVSYHYLVRPNGKVIQLVDDSALLWHAGNYAINKKSIGIALAGKFLDKEPTDIALNAVAKIIREHNISRSNVFGHNEVIKKEVLGETQCPGNLFLEKWKDKIMQDAL